MELFISKDLERKLNANAKSKLKKIAAEIEEFEDEIVNENALPISCSLILISPKSLNIYDDIYDDEWELQEEIDGYSDPCLTCECQGELCDCAGCGISDGRNTCSNCE